jgi:2-keto-4-pentenoate hydratase/2-oxohepta-3-ene-1,7-dioic acid hydratase in catechol pathway
MLYLPIKNSSQTYQINPSKVLGLGLNYEDHVRESPTVNVKGLTREIPKEPIIFSKTPNALIGAEGTIIIPKILKEYGFDKIRVDYEAELAFIIKDKCKNVPREKAYEHILGFTCMNDVSERNIQSADKSGWFRGKSFDTFGPIGPQIVLTEDAGDPQNLNISCRLNGEVRQNSNTKFMIFSIPEIVSFISRNFTLNPGDIITTGTSSGVGPMKDGDVVEVEIEGIGILKNFVVEEE